MTERKRGDKQIMGRGGVPVEIIRNPESERHSNKITLAVGGIETIGAINERVHAEETVLFERRHALTDAKTAWVRLRLVEEHPDAPSDFVSDSGSMSPLNIEYFRLEKEFDATHPDSVKELITIDRDITTARNKSYAFDSGKMKDLHVGKEGTLIYSMVPGGNITKEIDLAMARGRKILAAIKEYPMESVKYRVNFRQLKSPPDAVEIEKLTKKLIQAGEIVDIHQIEVLPVAMRKGIGSALLDVANWEIAKTHRIPFTIGRVLDDNPDSDKVIAMFEKEGFTKMYMAGEPGGFGPTIPNYWLLVKENV